MVGREALDCSRQGVTHQPDDKPDDIDGHDAWRHLRGSGSIVVHRAPAERALPVVGSCRDSLHAFPPLCGVRAQGRGREPARSTGSRDDAHQAGGVTPVEQYAGPAVKTTNPSLAPRGAERAVGGIRARGENPAAGPARSRLYSHSRRLRARIPKVARAAIDERETSSRARTRLRVSRVGPW